MINKSIVFTQKNKAEILESETDMLGRDDVLLKLEFSTISNGTERANITGEVNVSLIDKNTEAKFPRFGGYSSAGVVVAIGEGVTKVKVGDRVAAFWTNHKQYCILNQNSVCLLPEAVSTQSAAIAHIAAFPMAAIRKCKVEMGESAIVMGLGPLGLIAVQLLRAAGACPVIAADPIKEKRDLAISLGADAALDPFAPDFAEKAKALTAKGVNVAIEVTGNGQALDSVLDCMAQFGRVALLGCTRNSDFTIDYYHKVHGPGISLIGAHTNARAKNESAPGNWTTKDDMDAIIRLENGGRIRLANIVSEVHSPAEAPEVYNRLINERSFPVVQFDWRNFI